MLDLPLIAVDVGNARSKLGLFRALPAEGLPQPQQTWHLANHEPLGGQTTALAAALAEFGGRPLAWWIGSVNRPAASRLIDWIRRQRPDDAIVLLAAGDVPLQVRLERPDMVGVDRLLDAVAANRLRDPRRPAVVIDVGTAITVDLVAADGAFCGGAILPGIAMSARALHEFTDLLPLSEMSELQSPPPPLGTDTAAAMRAGLFWGAVGAIRELANKLAANEERGPGPISSPQIFLTGGASVAVAELLGADAQHVPHLTLAGIALAAARVG